MSTERELLLALERARRRRARLLTGFSAEALRQAGEYELEAAEDRLAEFRENRVEGLSARRLSPEEVERRRLCPPELYERVYG